MRSLVLSRTRMVAIIGSRLVMATSSREVVEGEPRAASDMNADVCEAVSSPEPIIEHPAGIRLSSSLVANDFDEATYAGSDYARMAVVTPLESKDTTLTLA